MESLERRRALPFSSTPAVKDSRNAVNCLEAVDSIDSLRGFARTKQLSILRPPPSSLGKCIVFGRDSSASVHPPIGNPSNGFPETRILDSRIGRNQQSGWSARFNSRSFERVGGVDCRGLMKKMGREVNGCRRDVSWWNYRTIVRNRDRVLLVADWSLSSMFVSFRIVERVLSMLLCVGWDRWCSDSQWKKRLCWK